MTDLKPGWQRVKFGDVVRLHKETCKEPAAEGIERYIGLEHIEPGDLRVRSWGDVSDGTTFTNRVRPGQVLFGKRRAYQRKIAVTDFDAVCSGDIYVFESMNPARLLPELLPFVCQTDAFFEHAVGTSAGSLSPRTNWSALASCEFVLPPLDEQNKAIEALTAITRTLESIRKALELARVTYRSAMDAAFGLPRTLKRSEVRARSDWTLVELQALADPERPISYGILQPGAPVPDGVPMLRVIDFDEFGRRSQTEVLRVTREVADTSRTTYLRAGDLLVSVMATVGRCFFVPPEMEGWNINRALAVIPCTSPEQSEYLYSYLQSGFVQQLLNAEKIGSAQPRINLADLKTLPVPLAPPEARPEISCVGRMLCDSASGLERRLVAARNMRDHVLQSTFGGVYA